MKKIIAIAVLAVGVLVWRVEAMQQGKSSGDQAPQQVIIETRDGLRTPVDISTAKLFGVIKRKIDAVSQSEPTVRFFDDFDVSLGKSTVDDVIELPRITKDTLDILLGDLPAVFNWHKTNNPEDILKLSDEARSNAVKFFYEPLFVPDITDNMAKELRRRLRLLTAAYELDMPELSNFYAVKIAILLDSGMSRRSLLLGEYQLLEIIRQVPGEVLKVIQNMVQLDLILENRLENPLDTIEKWMLVVLLRAYQILYNAHGEKYRDFDLQPTHWAGNTWRALSKADKDTLRDKYPDAVARLEPKKMKRAKHLTETNYRRKEADRRRRKASSSHESFKQHVVYPNLE